MSWFLKLFINEAKPALKRHSGGYGDGSGSDDGTQMYILVDEDGNEFPAVLVDEETVFDATPNDIREGKVAATETGVTVGTKEIPAYYVTEGTKIITAGKPMNIVMTHGKHAYTELLAVICPFNTKLANSVAVEKSCIKDYVYPAGSTDAISAITVDNDAETINLGISNDSNKPVLIRFFTYKEEQ